MLSFAWGNQGRLRSQAMLELSLKRIVGSEEEGRQHGALAMTCISVPLQEHGHEPGKLRQGLREMG